MTAFEGTCDGPVMTVGPSSPMNVLIVNIKDVDDGFTFDVQFDWAPYGNVDQVQTDLFVVKPEGCLPREWTPPTTNPPSPQEPPPPPFVTTTTVGTPRTLPATGTGIVAASGATAGGLLLVGAILLVIGARRGRKYHKRETA